MDGLITVTLFQLVIFLSSRAISHQVKIAQIIDKSLILKVNFASSKYSPGVLVKIRTHTSPIEVKYDSVTSEKIKISSKKESNIHDSIEFQYDNNSVKYTFLWLDNHLRCYSNAPNSYDNFPSHEISVKKGETTLITCAHNIFNTNDTLDAVDLKFYGDFDYQDLENDRYNFYQNHLTKFKTISYTSPIDNYQAFLHDGKVLKCKAGHDSFYINKKTTLNKGMEYSDTEKVVNISGLLSSVTIRVAFTPFIDKTVSSDLRILKGQTHLIECPIRASDIDESQYNMIWYMIDRNISYELTNSYCYNNKCYLLFNSLNSLSPKVHLICQLLNSTHKVLHSKIDLSLYPGNQHICNNACDISTSITYLILACLIYRHFISTVIEINISV
jgi:hypothetical protein